MIKALSLDSGNKFHLSFTADSTDVAIVTCLALPHCRCGDTTYLLICAMVFFALLDVPAWRREAGSRSKKNATRKSVSPPRSITKSENSATSDKLSKTPRPTLESGHRFSFTCASCHRGHRHFFIGIVETLHYGKFTMLLHTALEELLLVS